MPPLHCVVAPGAGIVGLADAAARRHEYSFSLRPSATHPLRPLDQRRHAAAALPDCADAWWVEVRTVALHLQ
jgi:hypothetical protein